MAKTGSERTKDWRAQLIAQGYKQKGMLLSPQALADLEAAKKRFGLTDPETVALALSRLQEGANTPPKRARKRGGEG